MYVIQYINYLELFLKYSTGLKQCKGFEWFYLGDLMGVYYLLVYGAPSRHKMMDDVCYSSLKQKLFEFFEFMQTKAVQNIKKTNLSINSAFFP